MNTKSLRKTISKAILTLVLLSGLEAKAQGPVTFSKPGNSMDYDHDGTSWVHYANTTYAYNSKGDLTYQLSTDPVTNQNKVKNEIPYDPAGNMRSYVVYQWQNNAWVIRNMQKDSMIYDINNNITQHFSKWLQNGIWESEKYVNIYDVNGNLTEITRSSLNNGVWEFEEKTTITLVNGLITEKLFELYNGTNWRNYKKEVYSSWHIPNKQPAQYTFQGFNSSTNQWTTPTRYTTTLTTNGGYITLSERFQNNAWVNVSRTTYFYDFKGNNTGNMVENYVNGTWVPSLENQVVLTYNSLFDITEEVRRWQNIIGGQISGPVVDQYKKIFSNFQYFTKVLGTKQNIDTKLALNVFPNPATDKIQIQLTESKPLAFTVSVKDITGKVWQTKTFKTGEAKQLDIEALPKGIYLLQLQTETGSTVKRIVKE